MWVSIVLTIMTAMFGLMCLICGLVAHLGYPGDPDAIPYYVGGYIVSPAGLLFALVSWSLHWKSGSCSSSRGKICRANLMLAFLVVIFAGGILGAVFAGVGAFVGTNNDDNGRCYSCRILAAILITCYICLMLISLCTMFGAWKKSKVGVAVSSNRERCTTAATLTPQVIWHTREVTREINTTDVTAVNEIRYQNRLIQEQLLHQQRLLLQQQHSRDAERSPQQKHERPSMPDEPPPSYSAATPSAPPPYEK